MEKKMMVEIPAEEMTAVESRFYTRKAMENLINILTRQLNGANNSDAKEVLEAVKNDFYKADIDFNLVQSEVIGKYFPNRPHDMMANFDFITDEVTFTWQE
jgi:hypothetical protein|nr:MAG TPA: hypothetical protein [Caudoviricetes sp.]